MSKTSITIHHLAQKIIHLRKAPITLTLEAKVGEIGDKTLKLSGCKENILRCRAFQTPETVYIQREGLCTLTEVAQTDSEDYLAARLLYQIHQEGT
jgi:hypothetical protein